MMSKPKEDDDMAQSMTTSAMTDGQINRAVEIFRAQLVKHQNELSSEAVQTVLGQKELGQEWLTVLRTRVEHVSNMIVRRTKVDRSLSPEAVLDATGRNKYTDKKVVKSMPKGEGDEVDVYFFKVSRFISDEDLEKEYALRGLVPADPYSQAAVNRDDPAFADEHPNGTHWKDADGKWCFFACFRWDGERCVHVDRRGSGWGDGWWFAGLRKD